LSEHVYSIQLNTQSVSTTSEIPFFVAPYAGFVEKVTYAAQLTVSANPGTAGEGGLTIRLKNTTKAVLITSAKSVEGVTLLSGLDLPMAATVDNREFRKGDVFTVNWTAASESAGTGPGIVVIGLHVHDGRYGGQILQSF